MKELDKFSDEELLMELRRRKRLVRVVSQQIMDFHRESVPDKYVWDRLIMMSADEIKRKILPGEIKIPGMKKEMVPSQYGLGHLDRRFTFPLNFVVEKS